MMTAKKPDVSPVFLTYAEASERLGLTVNWLQDQVQARLIPCHRLGRSVRFTQDDLAQIIAMTRQPAVGEGRAPRRRRNRAPRRDGSIEAVS